MSSADTYLTNEPFPHCIIDNAFDDSLVCNALYTWPTEESSNWWKYNNIFEKKLAYDNVRALSACLRHLLLTLNSTIFIDYLQRLTGIKCLCSDETFRGGGLHCIEKGGKLDIHADFNVHTGPGNCKNLHRRVNAILFMNKRWSGDYGGGLELWNSNMTKCVVNIEPIFNRLVIFSVSDTAFHGHPTPLSCPSNNSRKSMAWYYYSPEPAPGFTGDVHSTIYKKRPYDITNDNIEAQRILRAGGRLEVSNAR
jgi:Rps23 Pro-64 3,4-dihydroxylase Tpa1-like proline 4-hydroxylase